MFDSYDTITWFTDILIQGTLLLTFALIANFCMRKISSAWRHAMLLFATVGVPLLVVLSLVVPSYQLPRNGLLVESFETVVIQSLEIGASNQGLESSEKKIPAGSGSEEQTPYPSPSKKAFLFTDYFTVGFSLLVLWAVGVGAIWLRLAGGIFSLANFKSEIEEGAPKLSQVVMEESIFLELVTPPQLVCLGDDQMPMTWYSGRHFLALPSSAKNWPEQRLRNIVRHELAHIRRKDCQTSWLADSCLALLWFHPLAWYLRRSLGEAREAACDDLTLGQTPEPGDCRQYAQDLLDVVASHSRCVSATGLGLALGMTGRRLSIRNRLDTIMDSERDRRPVSQRARLLMIPLGIVGLSILASLTACQTAEPPRKISNPRTTGSHIQVKFQTVEFEDSALLEQLFDADSRNPSFTSVLSLEKMEAILKKLRRKGITPKSQPTMVSLPGKKARSELLREFTYPTEYSPPQLPNDEDIKKGNSVFPVTPSSPKSFTAKSIGLSYEVTASRADSHIGLDIDIEHTRFLGFINYGSPITTPGKDFFGRSVDIVITENRIEMPVFQAQKFKTAILVPVGRVIALIGFAPQENLNEDKHLSGANVNRDDMSPTKHTLYLIQPEFVDSPKP